MTHMKVTIEVYNGIQFERPTWDPTPVPWNKEEKE